MTLHCNGGNFLSVVLRHTEIRPGVNEQCGILFLHIVHSFTLTSLMQSQCIVKWPWNCRFISTPLDYYIYVKGWVLQLFIIIIIIKNVIYSYEQLVQLHPEVHEYQLYHAQVC